MHGPILFDVFQAESGRLAEMEREIDVKRVVRQISSTRGPIWVAEHIGQRKRDGTAMIATGTSKADVERFLDFECRQAGIN